jgi:hypothetical protein
MKDLSIRILLMLWKRNHEIPKAFGSKNAPSFAPALVTPSVFSFFISYEFVKAAVIQKCFQLFRLKLVSAMADCFTFDGNDLQIHYTFLNTDYGHY